MIVLVKKVCVNLTRTIIQGVKRVELSDEHLVNEEECRVSCARVPFWK